MRVLLITATSPAFGNSGSSLRTRGWMSAASSCADLGVVSYARDNVDKRAMHALGDSIAFSRSVPIRRSAWRRGRDLARAVLGRLPYGIAAAREGGMRAAVEGAVAEWRPHIVQAEGIAAAQYLEVPRSAGVPTVYSAHNVESRIAADEAGAALVGQRRATEWMRRVEEEAARRASAVVAVTQIEAAWFRRVAADVRCIPNAVELELYRFESPRQRQGRAVVFIGHLAYPPNVEAARRLVHCILPAIRDRIADAECIIAGRSPSRAIRELAGNGVRVLGDVQEMSEVWRQAAVLACPLRSGAGSRLKLLEAAALGVPIVCTAFAAEGLSLQPERDYFVGDSDAELARQAAAVLIDPAAAEEVAANARAAVVAEHDWQSARGCIAELYESLAGHNS